jgi:hypothetical protein
MQQQPRRVAKRVSAALSMVDDREISAVSINAPEPFRRMTFDAAQPDKPPIRAGWRAPFKACPPNRRPHLYR